MSSGGDEDSSLFWDDVFECYSEFRCELEVLLDEWEAENPGLRERVEALLREKEAQREQEGLL